MKTNNGVHSMKIKKNYEICFLTAACISLNYTGKLLADTLALPLWLDSVGTVFAAYLFGPFSGAVVGSAVNFIYSIHSRTAVFYALTNIMVGITAGICARRGFFKTLFGTLSTAFLVTFLAVLISTPLNYILSGGAIGNIWGDGMSEWLQTMGWNRLISNVIGQFYLEFVDKVLTMLLLFAALCFKNRKRKKKGNAGPLTAGTMAVVLILLMVCQPVNAAEAKRADGKTGDDLRNYVQTIYNGDNGLPSGEANTIAQTKDGVLWIGNYGGLYRYTGNTFQWMNTYDSVKSVNCLYTDEAGRLWIGTNDNGLSICIDQKISNVVDRQNGLPSNSVRCIAESSEGDYYVGTTDSMVVMSLSRGLQVCETLHEIVYADCVCTDADANAAVVTNEGELYLIHGTKVTGHRTLKTEGAAYNCCAFDEEGRLYVGTTSGQIEIYEVSEQQLHKTDEVSCGNLVGINSINFVEEENIFICAENGIGYFNREKDFRILDCGKYNSSIERMLVDYQGNLWFTSSRLGLLRLCPSVFTELYGRANLSEQVVNAVTEWKGCLYFGTDSGLDVLDAETGKKKSEALSKKLAGVRIRCFLTDSEDALWICTSDSGIWRVSEKGKIKTYSSAEGALGEKFRSAIELKDKTVVIAGDSGLTFIKDGKVVDTIGYTEGLTNPKVLSMCEDKDGRFFAGTDGNGIAVIEDGRVVKTLRQEEGLSSDIILRIVPESSGKGYFIVTGNGLCYMEKNGKIRFLNQFPYYNNFDVVEGPGGKLFVLGSAGIYIVDKAALLQGENVRYELLDSGKGLRMGLTPNSWNYLDEKDNLYLSGDRGAVCFNLNQYDITERSYRMLLQEIIVDGKSMPVEKGEPIRIGREAAEIEINPEIVNYSVNDPEIRIYLEGVDQSAKIMPQSKMSTLVYTNMPSGEYTLHVAVLDSRTDGMIVENTYRIVKEKGIYDNWWFRLYAGLVAAAVIAFLTWFFFRTQMQKTLRMQKMELEWTKKQLQMGNESILTIAQAVDAKDENTSKHSLRVSDYSVLIAEKLGYSEEQCEELRKIAMLHDIGKIGIPDRVLNKPGKLTDEEYDIMKCHVKIGAEILRNFTLIDHVADGALYHHERYDGRGYVNGLKGEEIPLNARIIGIADAFDAMTANRVYRKKLDMGHVLEELKKGRGTQFDPKLVDILLELISDGTIDVEKLYPAEDGDIEDCSSREMD